MSEKEAFEKAIDANPLEATNHLVYADWLDENNEPVEAEFRREMGKLASQNQDHRNLGKGGFRHYTGNLAEVFHQPEGASSVREDHLPHWARQRLTDGRQSGTRRYYPDYRTLENDLRQAFLEHKAEEAANPQTSPTQMSRRRIFLKKYRKGQG